MSETEPLEFARAIEVPYEPDPQGAPKLVCGAGPTELYYDTRDGGFTRVSFEGLDALKVCRGENSPYSNDGLTYGNPSYLYLYIVEPSHWLRERHAYEARFYRGRYEFGADVDSMLTEYDHYLLCFHDQFIEAIARGIWFERSEHPLEGTPPSPDHPLVALPESTITERLEVDGITCQIRTNPRPMDEILWGARYCSQPLYDAALELDGESRLSHRLSVRLRHGEVRSIWRGSFGPRVVLLGIATVEQVKAMLAPYMRGVAERRHQRRS